MKLFHKLLVLLTLVAVIPLAAGSAVLLWRAAADQRDLLGQVSKTFERTGRVGHASVSAQTWQSHLRLVEGKAAAIETALESIRTAVQLQGLLVRRALAEPEPAAPSPVYEGNDFAARLKTGDPEVVAARKEGRPYLIYRLAPRADPEKTRAPLRKLAGLGEVFAHQQRKVPWISSSYAYHASGLFVGYPGGAPFPQDYDPATRYWLKKAVEKRRVVWTKMYRDKGGAVAMTYVDPIFSADGSLLAAAAIDLEMLDLLDQLFDLRGLPVGDAMLLDYKGRVRASAAYKDAGGPTLILDPLVEDLPPRVYEHLGGRYTSVFRAMTRDRAKPSGVLTSDGKPLIEARPDSDLFAYARLKVFMEDGHSMDWYYVVRTPAAPVFKPVDRMRYSFASLATALESAIGAQQLRRAVQAAAAVTLVLALSVLLAYAAARGTSGPLVRVAEAVTKIAGGDFSTRLEVTSSDEIGAVQKAVNEMAAELQSGVFAKNTFKRFVSPEVVDQLLRSPELVRLGGERRVMTVMFSDIAGFTTLSEKMEPEKLVELLNEYFSAMTLCVFSHGGTLDKYVGDAMMAFWGAPLEQPDHAAKACLAALDVLKALESLQAKWRKQGLPMLAMRVGVNSGPMVVGNMGSMHKMDYTALGDAVNLASRLEGANSAYGTKILVGEWTWRAAAGAVEGREIDTIRVKGRDESERVFEVLATKGALTAAAASGCAAYARGLAAYRARRWKESAAAFAEADAALGGDPPSRVFLKRLEAFGEHEPGASWDGVFSLGEK